MSNLKWPLAAIGLCVVVFCGIVVLTDEPGVTRGNYGRIRQGMHKSEVEALFGAPASDMGTLPTKWLGLFLT
jgi:hypothetical protein